MINRRTVNWGIIGTGDVTEVKSGPGLYKIKDSKLVGVYNRTYEKALDYASRHGVHKVYRRVNALIEDPEIDVVYIATPPVTHKAYALQVLRAGKIPYIEKPLAMNYAEALEIKELSDELKIPVYVAYYRRGLEKFVAIKKMLDEKVIGQVKYVQLTQTAPVDEGFLNPEDLPWRVRPEVSGGGLFMDIGSHVLDCLIMFFGEFENFEGYAVNTGGYYAAEDTVMVSFKFQNGVLGTGSWCFVTDERRNEVVIVGDQGRIVYDGLSAKSFTVIRDGEEVVYAFTKPRHIAMPYEATIVNALLGRTSGYANFDHAVNLSKMMDKVLKPYYDRRK